MYRIIDTRGTGKTSRLMLIAKENDAIFVCQNQNSMRQKAYSYGITGIEFIGYNECDKLNTEFFKGHKIVVDDLEMFINFIFNGVNLIGYSLSKD